MVQSNKNHFDITTRPILNRKITTSKTIEQIGQNNSSFDHDRLLIDDLIPVAKYPQTALDSSRRLHKVTQLFLG